MKSLAFPAQHFHPYFPIINQISIKCVNGVSNLQFRETIFALSVKRV